MDLTFAVVPALCSFAAALIIGRFMIPLLHKLKFGQYIREEGPKSHLKKQGTPTMGGIIWMLALLLVSLIFAGRVKEGWIVIIMTFAFGLIGLLDDMLKEVFKHNEGLKSWQKFGLQFIVSVLFAVYLGTHGYGTSVTFRIIKKTVDFGFWYYVLVVFAMMAINNGTNFTDGLDGLSASVTGIIAFFLTIVCALYGSSLEIVTSAFFGGLLGYLCYNAYPAKVFMGDTGSLALGGFIGSIIFILDMPFMVLIFGIIYVAEVVSVILQVGYFKLTHGKRLFRMAPIHHHFEQLGWHETRVVVIFDIVTALACLVSLWILFN